MSWVVLVLAGLLEVGRAVGLKYTEGFPRPLPSVLTGSAIVASMYLLSVAARTLPIGTAYVIWVGIGAVGAALLGTVLFDEPIGRRSQPRTAGRLFVRVLLAVAIVGLKATASAPPS